MGNLYSCTLSDNAQRMPTTGKGGSGIARTIANPTITATSATSATVTDATATNAVAGDIIIAGQGNWGVVTAINGNVFSVKKWYRLGGGVQTIPPTGGNLAAFPGGVLRTAVYSVILGIQASAAGTTTTIVDALGTTIAVVVGTSYVPIRCWGPWRATASAATVQIAFETVGDLDV